MFEKMIVGQLKNGIKNFYSKELATIDADKDGLADFTEIADRSGNILDNCEEAFKSADLVGIQTGAMAIAQGVKTIMDSINVPVLLGCLEECKDDVAEVAKLIGLLALRFGLGRKKEIAALPEGEVIDVEGEVSETA